MTRLIDADALIEILATMQGLCDTKAALIQNSKIWQQVKGLPTVDAVPVRYGKWITEECLPGVAVCSICGHEIRGIGCQYTKYCDECGARMDKE